jgi:hypothetical protein
MVTLVVVGLGVWAAVATVACVSICMAAARFNHEADRDEAWGRV